MKAYKIALLLSLLTLISFEIQAQRFKGGIMAGLNMSQIDGDSWKGYNKAGLVAGAYVFTDFTEKWSGQMEVRFSAKGSSTPKGAQPPIKLRFHYIEIPILARYEFMDNLHGEAGVSLGYLFQAQISDGSGWVDFVEDNKEGEAALTFGVNYGFWEKLDVNARFSYSLFPIRGKYSGSTYGNGAWYHNVVTIGFYYQIGN